MTSYQKLKIENEHLKRQVNVFKNALTKGEILPVIDIDENGITHISQGIGFQRNKITDEIYVKELTLWVAENLDEKMITHLLELKEKLKCKYKHD